MPVHRRRRATQRSATTPIGPKGYGAASRLVSHPWKRVAVHRLTPVTATFRLHRRVAAACPRLLRCRSSAMEGHRRRRGASNPDPWRTQRTTLGDPAGPLGRKPHWAQHLAALATKPGEKYGQTNNFGYCILPPQGLSLEV